VPAGDPRDDALVLRLVLALPAVAGLVANQHLLLAGAVKQELLVLLCGRLPRVVVGDGVRLAHRLEGLLGGTRVPARARRDGSLLDRERGVGDDQLGVDLVLGAEPVARLARAVRRVEREVPLRQLAEAETARRAGEVLAEGEHLVLDAVVLPRDD